MINIERRPGREVLYECSMACIEELPHVRSGSGCAARCMNDAGRQPVHEVWAPDDPSEAATPKSGHRR